MINRVQRDRMRDYVMAKLEGSSHVRPVRTQVFPGVDSTYFVVDERAVVLLVDQEYPGERFTDFRRAVETSRPETFVQFLPLFYKDGKTFFRSAAKDNFYKQQRCLSLKEYSAEDMRRMIAFRPEEKETIARAPGRWLQYYQPESERLHEGIVSFKFAPVHFDYSHMLPEDRPGEKDSTRLHIWNDKREYIGNDLRFGKNSLIPRETQ